MKSDTLITISDAHTLHCMTEGHLDEWWRSLAPDRKVALFEAELDGLLTLEILQRSPEAARFQEYAAQFLADMARLQKSPFAGLISNTSQVGNDASV